jgi:phosphoribulokinase
MSTLLLNTLTGKTSAGSIVVTGEGGSTTTNMQQGLCKVWAKFNGSTFDTSGDDTFNVTSLTDGGTGEYDITIANDFASGDHVQLSNSNELHAINDAANGAGTLGHGNYNSSHNRADTARQFVASFGDLA